MTEAYSYTKIKHASLCSEDRKLFVFEQVF